MLGKSRAERITLTTFHEWKHRNSSLKFIQQAKIWNFPNGSSPLFIYIYFVRAKCKVGNCVHFWGYFPVYKCLKWPNSRDIQRIWIFIFICVICPKENIFIRINVCFFLKTCIYFGKCWFENFRKMFVIKF